MGIFKDEEESPNIFYSKKAKELYELIDIQDKRAERTKKFAKFLFFIVLFFIIWVYICNTVQANKCPKMTRKDLFLRIHKSIILDWAKNCNKE